MTVEQKAEEGLNKRFGTMGYLNKQNVARPYTDGFKDGYNKCFEQIRKIVNEHTRLDCIIPELLKLKESE